MKIFTLEQIKAVSGKFSIFLQSLEEGFRLYSEGKTVIPPVGHMHFNSPPGNLHIKYGHIPGEEYFVVKIASHFADLSLFVSALDTTASNNVDSLLQILFNYATGV